MKKISLATLLSLVVSLSMFAQTKKEKIEELFTINNKSYDKMIDGISVMFDKFPSFTKTAKEKYAPDSTIKPWVGNVLKPQDPQPFEDTANYNKLQHTKSEFKKIMLDMMVDMEKEFVPMYDSIFTEKQIDKMLTYQKSSASQKVMNSSMDLFTNGNFMDAMSDTSARTYVFKSNRKEKLDSLMTLMMPKENYKATSKIIHDVTRNSVSSNFKDTAERKQALEGIDSMLKRQQSDPTFTKKMEDIKKNIELKKEVGLDKNLSDAELTYLIAYYSDPETQELKQKETKLTADIMQKVMPKMLSKFGDLSKMAK